jgi:hypothetical protein
MKAIETHIRKYVMAPQLLAVIGTGCMSGFQRNFSSGKPLVSSTWPLTGSYLVMETGSGSPIPPPRAGGPGFLVKSLLA